MKLLYKPIAIVVGLLAGLLGRQVFNQVWHVVDEEDPPTPTQERSSWAKVLGAAAVQGLIFAVVRAAVERAGATGFRNLTGRWPGDTAEDQDVEG